MQENTAAIPTTHIGIALSVAKADAQAKPVEVGIDGYVTPRRMLENAHKVAINWWTVIDELHSRSLRSAKEPLPEWAIELIKGNGWANGGGNIMGTAEYTEFEQWICLVGRELHQGIGDNYEIWTRSGHRVTGPYAYLQDAQSVLENIIDEHPDAFVCRTSVMEYQPRGQSAQELEAA
ncbi:MAG: hypothetical protein ACOYBQ_09900 [Fluviibacter sp.]